MKNIDQLLSNQDYQKLLQAPAVVALLTALEDGDIERWEEKGAVKLAHTRTFTAKAELKEYYKEVDEVFEDHWSELKKAITGDIENKRKFLVDKLNEIDQITRKLPEPLDDQVRNSLNSFSEHVSRVNKNVLTELGLFIYPYRDEIANRS